MHRECQAFEQLPDWRKQHPINLDGYDAFLLSKEKRREEYKQRLAQCASNLKTLDSIEEAITRKKEEVELEQRTLELVQIDVCESASTHTSCLDTFVLVEYEILSVDVNAVSEFE